MTTQTTTARNLAQLATNLDAMSLHHQIEMTPEQARYFSYQAWKHSNDVGTQTGYGLSAWQLYRLIKQVDAIIPRMSFGSCNGQPNPNNGHAFHVYRVGRAYSRILYIDVRHLYIEEDKRASEMKRITASLKAIATHYKADEFNIEKSQYSTTFRLWWD